MSRFRYPYQKIVDLKTSEKTQAEWLLSAAVGKLQTEEMTLEKLYRERADWCDRIQQASQSSVALAELVMMQQYVEYVDVCIARKQTDVRQAQRQVDESRTELTGRMRDEKVWQKSKERAHVRFRSALQTKEQNELDEMATVRFMIR